MSEGGEGEQLITSTSVMSEMDKTEAEISSCYHRIDILERNLKYRPMTNAERETAEKDVMELKKILKFQEGQLKSLRTANRSSVAIAVILIIVAFLIFGLYKMYLNAQSHTAKKLHW